MRINKLQWDDDNVEHIARHGVNPQEVEDVCFGFHIYIRESSKKYIISGQSANGRYLNVVIETVGKQVFRPITAFEMSENYKRRYKKRLGR
jgi:hypothetical protein